MPCSFYKDFLLEMTETFRSGGGKKNIPDCFAKIAHTLSWVSGFHIEKSRQDPFVKNRCKGAVKVVGERFNGELQGLKKKALPNHQTNRSQVLNIFFWKASHPSRKPVAYLSKTSLNYTPKHLRRLQPLSFRWFWGKNVTHTHTHTLSTLPPTCYLGFPGNKNQMHAKDENKQPGAGGISTHGNDQLPMQPKKTRLEPRKYHWVYHKEYCISHQPKHSSSTSFLYIM